MARPPEPVKRSQFTLLASIAIIIAGLYFAREVLIPIALAVLLSFLLAPPVRWLERIKLPRAAATLIVVALTMALLGGAAYFVGRQLYSVGEELPTYESQIRAKFSSFGAHFGFLSRAQHELAAMTTGGPTSRPANADGHPAGSDAHPPQAHPSEADPPEAHPPDGQTGAVDGHSAVPNTAPTPENPWPVRLYPQTATNFAMLREYASTVMSPLATAVLVLVFVIFMIFAREDLRDRIIRLLGHGRLNVTTQALDEASTRISSYLGALAIVNGCYAVVTAVGLWVIGKFFGQGHGFPNVIVWGLLVGLCRFIPYVGIWVGAGIPLLLSFGLFPGNGVLIGVFILFAVLEIVVGQFVEPTWYGASTGMSALAVLVAAVFWAWLWGGIGLLLSTPLTVILVVIGKYVPQLKFLDILLREEAVLTPPYRFYQRLIALDQDEASDLARDYLKEKRSLEMVFDDLLIHALSLAEADHEHDRLDEKGVKFTRQAVRDIIDEVSEQYRAMQGDDPTPPTGEPLPPKESNLIASAASTMAAAASTVATVASNVANAVGVGSNSESETVQSHKGHSGEAVKKFLPRLPQGCMVSVICLPARDEADELVAVMLSQLLESRGYCAYVPTPDVLASEMIDLVESKKADVVCVSAMPPAAVAHARYLCKRLHVRFPDLSMVVGLWTFKGDVDRARERIACSSSVRLLTTLTDAQRQIEELAQTRRHAGHAQAFGHAQIVYYLKHSGPDC